MPFAHNCGLVARLLQKFRQRLLTAVEPDSIVNDSVEMAVLARQDNCSAWRADAVGAETVVESYASGGKSVDIWCLVNSTSIRTDGVRRMVVAHDEDDIRPFVQLRPGHD